MAVPVVVPAGMPENRSNHHTQVDPCDRDKQQVEQNTTVPDNAMAQDSNSRVETVQYVVLVLVLPVVLPVPVEESVLMRAILLPDEQTVCRQLVRLL